MHLFLLASFLGDQLTCNLDGDFIEGPLMSGVAAPKPACYFLWTPVLDTYKEIALLPHIRDSKSHTRSFQLISGKALPCLHGAELAKCWPKKRYPIEERRKIVAWMEVLHFPSIAQEKFKVGRDAPLHLTVGRIYEKFVQAESIQDDCKVV
ncbi:hypothetical protein Trydic_g1523 [Trypoxylus dichotomus]